MNEEFKNELEWVEMQIEHLAGKAEQQLLYALEWGEYEQKCREEITRLKHEITNFETDLVSHTIVLSRIHKWGKRETDAMLSSRYYEKRADEYFYLAKEYEKQRNKMLKDYEDNIAKAHGNSNGEKHSTFLVAGFMKGCE